MNLTTFSIATPALLLFATSLLAAPQEAGSTAFTCVPRDAALQPPRTEPPTLLGMGRGQRRPGPVRGPYAVADEPRLQPACRAGEVPIATVRDARQFPKGNPLLAQWAELGDPEGGWPAPHVAPPASATRNPCYDGVLAFGVCYYYESVIEWSDFDGGGMTLEIESPTVDAADGSHSIGQIAVTNTGAAGASLNDVEMGFSVSPGQFRDNDPHLFVYHFNSVGRSCYDASGDTCGWNQYSDTYYPGVNLSSLVGQRVYLGWVHAQGAWWAWFDDQWLGFIEDSVWNGMFTQPSVIQWYGEVAEVQPTPPRTQMGNGQLAENPAAASLTTLCNADANRWECSYGNSTIYANAWETQFYDMLKTGPGEFRYGGPKGPTQ